MGPARVLFWNARALGAALVTLWAPVWTAAEVYHTIFCHTKICHIATHKTGMHHIVKKLPYYKNTMACQATIYHLARYHIRIYNSISYYVPYYIILYYIILYYIILYYIILYYIILYYIILYCIILYYIVLYCILLNYTILC